MVFFMSLLHIGNQSWKRTNSKWKLRHWKSTWLLFKANAMRNTLILIRLLSLSYTLEKNISFKLDFSHFSSLETLGTNYSSLVFTVYVRFTLILFHFSKKQKKLVWKWSKTKDKQGSLNIQDWQIHTANIVTMAMSTLSQWPCQLIVVQCRYFMLVAWYRWTHYSSNFTQTFVNCLI